MFKFFDVNRRSLTFLMIALMACLITLATPAEEIKSFGKSQSIGVGGPSFEDPDEDAPDPDPFEDPDEDAPDPDPFEDPDEDAPDPDPLRVEVHPLVLHEATTVLFHLEGPAFMTLYNATGQQLLVAGSGSQVATPLVAGAYEVRVEVEKDSRDVVLLHVERIP